jgi:pimeloyl-ACP methyl ester carboxylesterase
MVMGGVGTPGGGPGTAAQANPPKLLQDRARAGTIRLQLRWGARLRAVDAPGIVVELPGGRVLAADDVGDPAGTPVLYLHGAPDCRLARHPDDGVAAEIGIRLVAVDRPGYGASDPLPIADPRAWAADVEGLVDRLGIDRFGVAAWSAGAPWAFGLAAALGDRVARIVTYGCLAPYEAFEDPEVVAASGPRAGVVEELAGGMSLAELVDGFTALLVPPAPVDLDVARDLVLESYGPRARADVESVPGMVDQLARSLAAAVERHGAAGLAADLVVQFDVGLDLVLAEVGCPVVLVHGASDPVAGPGVGAWLAARLRVADVEVWDRGHQGLLPEWGRWLAMAAAQ